MKKARNWINKKLKQGVSKKDLYNSVGVFSNKDKKIVMKQKGLSESQYKERYDFCFKVFSLLENEYNK